MCEEPWGGDHVSETRSWLVVWTRQTHRLRGRALEHGQPPSIQQAQSQVCLQTLKHPRVAIWTSGYPSIHQGGEAVLRRVMVLARALSLACLPAPGPSPSQAEPACLKRCDWNHCIQGDCRMMMKTEIRVKLLLAEQSQRWPAKLSTWVRGQGQSLPQKKLILLKHTRTFSPQDFETIHFSI